MAEVLLGDVLRKLAMFTVDKAIEKALSLYGIREEVDKLSRELNYVKAFIKDADRKHIVEERQMQLVKDIIDIAYEIEDAVDIFHSECPEKLSGIRGHLIWLPKKISKIPFLYQFQQQVKKIQNRISEIKEFRETYEITTLGEANIPPPNPQLIPIVDDSEVVGFDTHRGNVAKCLLDKAYRSLAVVSIVGSGGLGKTTLARKVCSSDDVSKYFGNPIWITVSQAYDLLKILQKIARDLNISTTNTEDESELAIEIREFLEKKRYLIVFDDVWREDLWEKLKNVMPDKTNGSRVLITTRFENVAKMADTKYDPYVLLTLDDEQSLKLFLAKAIPKKHQCPDGPTDDFRSLAEEFITKCKGLPLALVVLGSLLSTKPYNFHEWKKFLDAMSWQVDGSKCIDVIATSYEYLPLAKKLCFLYFAAYPEDFEVEIKPLLQIWVAERLIPQEDTRTLEETAECFLEDLIQRSMVQVSRKFDDGSITHCRVHDVLRDLAIQRAKELNFLIVCSKPNDWKSCNKAHRAAIHFSSNVNEMISHYANPNIRSLLLFGQSNLDCSRYKVLRVLGCMEWDPKVVLHKFKGLPHLRYLKLVSDIEGMEREFGEWIKSMKYLETLDLENSKHGDLSKWIWQVKTLRNAILYYNYSTQGPPASVDLRKLQTLKNVSYSESRQTSGSPNMTELRELVIQVHEKYFSKEEIVTLLNKLEHLIFLDIRGISAIDLGKIIWKDFPFYKNLKYLFIMEKSVEFDDDGNEGVLTTDIDGINKTLVLSDDTLPPHLTYLGLDGFKFVSDPMSMLQKLPNLKKLFISWSGKEKVLMGWRFRCSAGGFKQLEELSINDLMVDEWELETGTMPMLKKLTVGYCDPLRVPLELVHLPSLKFLCWKTRIQTNIDMIHNIHELRPDMHIRFKKC